MSVRDALRGARVDRVEVWTDRRALVLDLALRAAHDEARTRYITLLCSVDAAARGLGAIGGRKRPRTANAPSVLLARVLEGARLVDVKRVGTALVWLDFERDARPLRLGASFRGRGAFVVLDHEGATLWSLDRDADRALEHEGAEPFEPAADLDELAADGRSLLAQLEQAALQAHRERALRALRGASSKRERRLAAIEGDRAKVSQASMLRADAALLLSNLHLLARDATELATTDEMTDPPTARVLHIDPALGPKGQVEAWFGKARKLERGARMAEERARATQAELRLCGELIAQLERAASHAAIDQVLERARELGVAHTPSVEQKRKAGPAVRTPYREFRGSGGRAIYVGKSAKDNDTLTLKHAKPHDLWLHVRDGSGSHVIVPLSRDEACPPDLLTDAATLAAHFSSARGEARVDVIHTPRRYVQKPRKSAPGSVLLLREKVLRLELEPARLARVLAAEWAPAS